MNNDHVLSEYTKLIRSATISQTKASITLEKTIKHFEDEKTAYENFNNSVAVKYIRLFQPVLIPVIAVLVLALCAFVFVSTGHAVNFEAGNYAVQAR